MRVGVVASCGVAWAEKDSQAEDKSLLTLLSTK